MSPRTWFPSVPRPILRAESNGFFGSGAKSPDQPKYRVAFKLEGLCF